MDKDVKARHTPGEWKVLKGAAEGDDMRCAIIVEQGKMQYLLATIENGPPGDFCETEEANAHLIAAAPDLMEALCDLLSYHDVPGPVDAPLKPLLKAAFAAISKATGES